MTTQFVVNVAPNMYALKQSLPLYFKDQYFNGKKHVYLINNNRIRRKVAIRLLSSNELELYGQEWEHFVEDSGYHNLETLHFIHDSADTFYVTGYDNSGRESGGYDELLTRGRMTRCFARLGQSTTHVLLVGDFIPGNVEHTYNVTVNGNVITVTHRRQLLPGYVQNYENVLFGNGWDALVRMLPLTPRIQLVFTKVDENTFSMMVFAADGWELTNEKLRRTQVATGFFGYLPNMAGEKDPRMLHVCRFRGHDRHFDENATFYRPLLAHVLNRGQLTIPADFVRKHELYNYNHAMLHHEGVEYKVRLDVVFYRKKPNLNSHVRMMGRWDIISMRCRFWRNKIIRFNYVADVEDEDIATSVDSPVIMPMFDIC